MEKDRYTNSKVYANTKDMSEKEWLEARKGGLGGSDIGAIFGVSNFKSPLAVYLDKTSDETEPLDSEAAYWGTVLEDVVAEEFKKEHPEFLVQRRNAILQHPEHNWALANIDRLIKNEDGKWGILEIKTTSEYMKSKWSEDEVPDSYYLQLQHYLFVTGLEFGYFAVLIGGNKYREFYVPRDEDIIKQIIDGGAKFWNEHILAKNPPEWDGSDSAEKIIKSMYPESNGDKIELEATEKIETIKEIEARAKELDKEKKKLQQEIKAEMGEAEKAVSGDYKISWKSAARNSVDSKKLKKEKPEIWEQYIKTSKYRTFKIS